MNRLLVPSPPAPTACLTLVPSGVLIFPPGKEKLIKEELIKSEKELTISFIFISFIYQVSRRNASKQKLDENWIEHFFFPPSFCLFVNLRKFDKIVGSGIVCLIQINLMKEKRRGKPSDYPPLIRPKLLRNTDDRTNIQQWLAVITRQFRHKSQCIYFAQSYDVIKVMSWCELRDYAWLSPE